MEFAYMNCKSEEQQTKPLLVNSFIAKLKQRIETMQLESSRRHQEYLNGIRIRLTEIVGQNLDDHQFGEIVKICQEYMEEVNQSRIMPIPSFSAWKNEDLNEILPEFFEYSCLDDQFLIDNGIINDAIIDPTVTRLRWWLSKFLNNNDVNRSSTVIDQSEFSLKFLDEFDFKEAFVRIILNEILMCVLDSFVDSRISVEENVKHFYKEIPHGILDYSFYLENLPSVENGGRKFLGLLEAKRGKATFLSNGRIQSTIQLLTKYYLENGAHSKNTPVFAVASTGYKFLFISMNSNEISVSKNYSINSVENLKTVVSIFKGLMKLAY